MMTDKATVEMESPVAGVVKKLAGEVGDQIAIGSVLVEIETTGDAPVTVEASPVRSRLAIAAQMPPASIEPLRLSPNAGPGGPTGSSASWSVIADEIPPRAQKVIASNPPYVDPAQRASLPPELAHEPEIALFAERRGLALLEEIAHGAAGWLAPGGSLALEHAPDQADAVAAACRAGGLTEVSHHRDLAGRPRVTTARRRHDADAPALR